MTARLNNRIGFIGAGQMAQALARGFVAAGLIEAEQIIACDPVPAATEALAQAVPGVVIAHTNDRVLADADVVILAVKPQHMVEVAAELSERHAEPLLISIAAGVTLSRLEELFGSERVIRVMPNTPSLVGECAAGYAVGVGVSDEDRAIASVMLEAVGVAFELDEKLIDAVTGLSGSGPAFVYLMIEALSDGGVKMGLPRHVATQLAAQTVRGAATMVQAAGDHPGLLKDKVASPGGTTIAGLAALEQAGVRGGLIAAVEAATQRSRELGRDNTKEK